AVRIVVGYAAVCVAGPCAFVESGVSSSGRAVLDAGLVNPSIAPGYLAGGVGAVQKSRDHGDARYRRSVVPGGSPGLDDGWARSPSRPDSHPSFSTSPQPRGCPRTSRVLFLPDRHHRFPGKPRRTQASELVRFWL